jgi:hypothetical protein
VTAKAASDFLLSFTNTNLMKLAKAGARGSFIELEGA